MSGFVLTLIISVILVLLAVGGLCIGLIITGKTHIVRGACGRAPSTRRDEHCGKEVQCTLCESNKEEK